MCTPGEARCETVRERCDEGGSWQPTSFVCAVDISGAQEQSEICAVKSDGRMTCFGASDYDPYSTAFIAHAPDHQWKRLFVSDDPVTESDDQLCGIDQLGNGTCWGTGTAGRQLGPVSVIANGSNGLCLVGPAGDWSCPEAQDLIGDNDAGVDRVVDLQMRSGQLDALKLDGTIIEPASNHGLSGVYTRISASDRELCALRQDHTLECEMHAVPSALASQRFLELVVTSMGAVCATREDHTIVCDPLGDSSFKAVPPEGQFTRIAVTGTSTICGIRIDGSIACFSDVGLQPPADW